MKYRNKTVEETPTLLLLFELIQRMGTIGAPHKIKLVGDWEKVVIGIGTDHSASILISVEDKEELYNLVTQREITKRTHENIWG